MTEERELTKGADWRRLVKIVKGDNGGGEKANISNRISGLSSSKEMFHITALPATIIRPLMTTASMIGYHSVKNMNPRNRRSKIILFTHFFSLNVKSNI